MTTEGRVDGVRRGFLMGWAHDPARPGDRLELDARIDAVQLGRCLADLNRGDLVRRGIGDGRHAFRVKLPQPLEPGSEHLVTVRACADGTILPLAENYHADPSGDPEGQRLILTVEPGEIGMARPRVDEDGGGNGGAEALRRDETGSRARESAHWLPPRPSVPQALLGSGGWLFAYEGPERLARVLGTRPASADKARAQVRVLQAREERLKELGVGYLVATMPNKAAVYAEHLPPGLTLEPEGRPADQLSAVLREDARFEILDLLAVLRHARRHGRAFLRQGDQLTWNGAFHAARAVTKELAKRFAAVQPPSTAALELGTLVESTDQLSLRERVTLLGGEAVLVATSDEIADRDADLARKQLTAMYVPLPTELAAQLGSGGALLEHGNGADLPRAVVLHDGPAQRLVPFLAESFGRTLVEVTDAMPYPVIEQERPMVVIQFISEDGSFFA